MTLTDFLLARIAEDEAEIGAPFGRDEKVGPNGVGWAEVGAINDVLMCGQARALAECKAKRRIVELHRWESDLDDGTEPPIEFNTDCFECRQAPPCPTLRALVLPYNGHPDYREEWKP